LTLIVVLHYESSHTKYFKIGQSHQKL